ncbi:MAG: lamin tail domain-containing protein [Saprospiraceae bacterium]|nr:lamin tail domain-containing protein [Saprospiraceae bacterium]MBP7699449.1 lamin tail domain-containing protein [Saprospiraceae bacterium]
MKNLLLRIVFILFAFCANAQVQDDFSDGDFTNNPTWTGDAADFTVNASGELQLAAAASGSYALVVGATLLDTATWEFRVAWNTASNLSSANSTRIYLMSNTSDLSGNTPIQGYYIRIGENSNTDAIKLYRKNNSTETLLFTGTTTMDVASANVRIRVTRSTIGEWAIAADVTGGTNFVSEGTPVVDATYNASAYWGVRATVSSTNLTAFRYDDFYCAPIFQDVTPPSLFSATPISATQVDVLFTELLDITSAQTVANYVIDNGIGVPATATLDNINTALVHLTLTNPLVSPQTYTLQTTNIKDVGGNASATQTATFSYIVTEQIAEFDLVINEFMADFNPVPPQLPAAEYIEIYNNSNKVINLKKCTIEDATNSKKELPEFIMLPHSYVIVTDNDNAFALSFYGDVAEVASFPSLNESNEDIILRDSFENVIHQIHYDYSWYNDEVKLEGGWSCEMINPNVRCGGSNNWQASLNANGGSPGQENSVFVNAPDTIALAVASASVIGSNQVTLTFNKVPFALSVEVFSNYFGSNGIGNPIQAMLDSTNAQRVILTFDNDLPRGIQATITVVDILDCVGNLLTGVNAVTFFIAEIAAPQDIVINEILFNPETGGARYVELYNRSTKTISLEGLRIANFQSLSSNRVKAISVAQVIQPNEYFVLTYDTAYVPTRYFTPNPNWLFEQSLPSLEDNGGNISIYIGTDTTVTTMIDSFDYSRELQYPLLSDNNGVALERINPGAPTNAAGNWHSAAKSVNYGTPTNRNSQYFLSASTGDEVITLAQDRFSPDLDGFEDFLLINYITPQAGYTCNINIYDAKGRLIKQLVRNELLANEGSYQWNGETDDAERADMGIYVVWVELFNPNGEVKVHKKACVLAVKL